MKLICPHCGLGGTADLSLFGRKVRCPECRKVFVVNDEAAFPIHKKSCEDGGRTDASARETTQKREELAECSICGYTLKREFLRNIDSALCCTVCVLE
jgi:hypothetical protein